MKKINEGFCQRCNCSLSACRYGAAYCGNRCRTLDCKARMRVQAGGFLAGTIRHCFECNNEFSALFSKHTYCTDKCVRLAAKKRDSKAPRTLRCTVCNADFPTNSSMHQLCSKKCIAERKRQIRLAAHYGLTTDAFDALLQKQNGGCAICQTQEMDRCAVDHDHSCCGGSKTCGKCIRGILCYPCNTALGLFKDSAKSLARALDYLSGTNSNEAGQLGSVYQ